MNIIVPNFYRKDPQFISPHHCRTGVVSRHYFDSRSDAVDARVLLNPLKDKRGSALIAAMAFAAFLTLVIVAVCKIVDENRNARVRAKILDSRNLVLKIGLRNARVATYYYKTITSSPPDMDPVFKDCMIGDGVTPQCNAGGPYPLALIDDSSPGIPVMGSSASKPVFYNIYGQICSALNTADCLFKLWATFNASCPLSGSPCFQAATINITVYLEVTKSAYQNNVFDLPVLSATELVSISNFFDFYDPAFPPVVRVVGTPAHGAPISGNSGPRGSYHNYVAPFSSTGLCTESYSCSGSCTCIYSGVVSGSSSVSGSGLPPPPTACQAGSQSISGSCTSFNF